MKKIIILFTLVAMLGSSCVENEATRLAKAEQQQRDSIALVQKKIADSIALDQKLASREAFSQQYPIATIIVDPTMFSVDTSRSMQMLYSLLMRYASSEEIDLCHEFPKGNMVKKDLSTLLDIALALTLSMTERAATEPRQVANSSVLFDFDASNPDETKLLRTLDRHMTVEEKVWLNAVSANHLLADGSGSSMENRALQIIISQLALRKHLQDKK